MVISCDTSDIRPSERKMAYAPTYPQALVGRPVNFTDSPVQVICPVCHQTVVTKVEFSSGLLTYLFCGGLLFCGCVLGCCLIPFCVNRLRNASHICPSCKSVLGVYKRL